MGVVVVVCCGLIVASCGQSEPSLDTAPAGQYREGELIVKFVSGISQEDIDRVIGECGGEGVIEPIGDPAETMTYLVKLELDTPVEEAVESFEAREEVEYAEPNYEVHILEEGNP